MAVDPIQWLEFADESEVDFSLFKDRVYAGGDGATLPELGLQKGDTLPDDPGGVDNSSYEIISSKIEFIKPRESSARGGSNQGRAVRVRAFSEKVESGQPAENFDWAELVGSRDVVDTDPQTIRYTITFTGLTAATVPPNGSTYSAFTGTGSLASTGLDREPVSVVTSQKLNVTDDKSHVTVVFQAHHARVNTGSPATEINPRQLVRTGRRSWKGRRRFSVPISGAEALENGLYGGIFPNKSGKYAPKCNRVETHDNWEPGRSLVVADYETPRVVGEGRLRIEVRNTRERKTEYVQDGKTYKIGPEEYDAVGGTGTAKKHVGERRIIQGENLVLRPQSIIILETAATEFNLNTFMNKVGHVNKYRLPNFGNAQPGTLLFLGPPNTTYRLVGDLWYLNLAFQYSGDPTKPEFPKWNAQTKSQLGTNVARKTESVDANGAVVPGSAKWMVEWTPQERDKSGALKAATTTPVVLRNYPEADFQEFGKNLVITGTI